MRSFHFIKGAFWWSGNNVINQKDPGNTNASPSLELCYLKNTRSAFLLCTVPRIKMRKDKFLR